ncbi:hypothetical protein CR983_04400, partial [Candidatus Saccharibacteria bacterium]
FFQLYSRLFYRVVSVISCLNLVYTRFYLGKSLDIYAKDSDDFIALVTTDYADPLDQSRELKGISGQYKFEFTDLIKPYDAHQTLPITDNDDMSDTFFVTAPYKKHRLYYYLANLKYTP